MEKSLILSIKKELQSTKTRYGKKYGAAIFDVKVKSFNDIIFLKGVVLSDKQKKEVFLAVKEIIKDNKIESEIKVLSDPKDKLEIGWGVVTARIADIWVKLSDKKNIIGKLPASTKSSLGGLASQASKGDAVRVLAKKGIWRLVQTRDLAIGWINKYQVSSILEGEAYGAGKYQVSSEKWIKGKRARQNKTIRIRLAKNIQSKFFCFLEKYLNARYLLGGMTDLGIDCSGLTEKFYSDILGIILPRHSSDQALCGEKIEPGAAHFGDLIFLRRKATKLAHIGVVAEKIKTPNVKRQAFDNILILNARRENGRVAIENLSDILKFYDLISVKRIIKQVLIKKRER